MEIGWIIVLVIGGLILLTALVLVAMYNGFVGQRNRVDEAFSTMDVYLKKRFDLIPNVVETVKGYAKHEKETLAKVIELRNNVNSSANAEEKLANESKLTAGIRQIFALAEAYPDLKANTNFVELQNTLKAIESDITNARKYYNATVREFNTRLDKFPGNIVGKWFGFKRRASFVVDDVAERSNVKVKFE